MSKGVKIFLLILFTAIVAGGVGFLAYNIHSEMNEIATKEQKDNGKDTTVTDDNAATTDTTDDTDTGYILIGDSRFVGMDLACEITDNPTNREYVVAKVGEGLSWLENEGLTEASEIEQTHTYIRKWKYVICLGVNDLWDLDKYKDEYLTLKNQHDLMIVSVGPTTPPAVVDNDDVTVFNQQMSEFCEANDIPYIDYNTVITKESFEIQADGLHYKDSTYRRIYEIIEGKMRES